MSSKFADVLDAAREMGFDIPEARPKSTTKAFGPTVIDAIKALDSVCDRARTQDKVGFDKFVREKYEDIIQKAVSEGCLSPKEEDKAYHFLKRYTKQLKGLGIDYNEIGHITRDGKDENRQPEQCELTIVPVGKELELEDVCESKIVNEGEENERVEYKFSPEKACNAIMVRYNLVSTPDKTIWVYQDGYYSPQGWENILKTVHVIAGDYFNKHMHAELDEKIYYLTRAGEDPFNKKPYLLCCKNKTINLLTGDVLEHSPEDLTTDQIPVSYDLKATCPEIVKFIATLTPDEDDRRTLLDIIASGAYRQALYYIAFLIGHGSSGSTVFIELIQAFYGATSTEAIPLNELIEKQFALSNLRNARYSFGQEIDEVKKAGTSRVKEISGGDWISADVKNKQDRARFRGWTKLIFKGNSMPRFTDNTWGFRRRFIEVVLPYKFVPAVDENEPNQRQEDPDILEKITTPTELSGLLNLVIARLPEIIKSRRIYRKEGSFEAMKEQVDSVLTFFETFCLYEPGSYTDKDSLKTRIPVKTLHANFEKWCGLIKGNLVEKRQFGKYVKKFCEDRSPIETTVDGKTETVYVGLFFDQTSFDLEIKRLEMILKNGCNPFRPDINRIKTGLEKSQKITNTGCTGLKEDIDTIRDAGTHNVQATSLVEKDLSSISGISGFRDAKVKNASDFDPVTSGITSGEESKKENLDTDLPLMDKTDKTIRWTDDEPTIETQLKQAQVEAAKREAHFTTPDHHTGLSQAKQAGILSYLDYSGSEILC